MDPTLFEPRKLSAREQLAGTMFDLPSVAVATSEDAAESVRGAAARARYTILLLLADHPSAAFELARDGQWSGDFTRPRLRELEQRELIEKCDGKAGRPLGRVKTPSHNSAMMYQLTEKGRAVLASARGGVPLDRL